MKRTWIFAALSTLAISACSGGSTSLPPVSSTTALSGVKAPQQAMLATPKPTPVPTATAAPTTPAADLPILKDTSTSTEGVFIGEACPPSADVPCANFSSVVRHGIALGTLYTSWGADFTTFLADNTAGWQAQGIIPEITWEPQATFTYASVVSGDWDSKIIAAADELKAYGSPVFLRPFHEFNTDQFSWGLSKQGADAKAATEFIAAWRHMVELFRAQGATNVKFVWCFATGTSTLADTPAWNEPSAAYPGDDYVDWISFDTFNQASMSNGKTWYSFQQIVNAGYATATSISANKPISISETASNEWGDGGAMKAAWINDMLYLLHSATNPYPSLRLVTWYDPDNTADGYNYNVSSSTPALTTLANALRVKLADGTLAFRSNGAALATITKP
jgi:hypothetical protein